MPVPVMIALTFDDKGAIVSVRRIGEEGEKAGQKVKDGLGEGEKAAVSLKDQILATAAGFVTAQAAIGLVEKGFARLAQGMTDAAARDRQILGLTSTMRTFGLDVERGSKQIDTYTKALQRAGFAGSETREAIQRFLPVTKNLESAIAATNIAQGLHVQTGREMTSIYEMMGQLLAGRVTESVALYGVTIDKTKTQAEQAASALQQLAAQTKGVAENADDAAAAQGRFNELMNGLWTSAGKDVNTSLGEMNRLLSMTGTDVESAAESLRRAIPAFVTLDMTTKVLGGNMELLRQAMESLGVPVSRLVEVGKVNTATMTDEQLAALALANRDAELALRARETAMAEAGLARAHTASEAAAKRQAEAIQTLVSSMEAAAASRDILSTLTGGIPTSEMSPDIPLGRVPSGSPLPDPQVVAMDAQAFLDVYQVTYLDPLALLDQQYRDTMLQADTMSKDQRLAVETAYYAEKKRLRDMEAVAARAEVAGRMADAGRLFGGLAQLSGNNFKMRQKFQIGEAVMNGISAAIKSFDNGGGYPWGLVPMAASIATTAGQIQQIRSQKPPAYEQGTPYVPRTGLALVHQGEAVIPRSMNPYVDSGGGGGLGNVTVQIDARGAWFDSQERVNELARRCEDAVRRGYVRRAVA